MMKQKESKEDRFRRLAEARVNKILQLFRLLGNLSWTGTYAYTRDQVEQIFTTLQWELTQTKRRFLQAQKHSKKRFSLGEPYWKEGRIGIMPEIDWIIHIVANGMRCEDCGKTENPFPLYICNALTHGMERYGHRDFQMVIHMAPQDMGYVLNTLGLRVQAGESFKAGDLVEGIFLDCPVRLDEFEECGRKLLRVIIPDATNRFPEDPECTYPYNYQLIPTDELGLKAGWVS